MKLGAIFSKQFLFKISSDFYENSTKRYTLKLPLAPKAHSQSK